MRKISRMTEVGPAEETAKDALTEVLRQGAQRLLREALEAEVEECIAGYLELRSPEGHQRVVRNGHLPKREIQTGIGGVEVRAPRVRDRSPGENPIRFTSSILPPYLRRSKSLDDLLPWLYLKGISTGDFSDALVSLVGENAPGLSPTTISRLKRGWEEDYGGWCKRDLSAKEYVYIWADGIYFQSRMDDAKQCILVLLGSTPSGDKELIGILDGYRESESSWLELLLDMKERGVKTPPKLAIGDGALGFWKALAKAYPETKAQRCWLHKTGNILNKLPKQQQPKAKALIQEIWMSESREEAKKAMGVFVRTYEAKYPKATDCLMKDETELLAFYDFPAEHWKHLRTTNPIESTFATVRLRTSKTRGCLSRVTTLSMVFQLCRCAQKRWRKLSSYELLGKVISGVKFVDGVERAAA